MELFEQLNKEGMTVIMITHDSEIAAHAKRTVLIRDGILTGAGSAAGAPADGSQEREVSV